jgi:hypothetical protein
MEVLDFRVILLVLRSWELECISRSQGRLVALESEAYVGREALIDTGPV